MNIDMSPVPANDNDVFVYGSVNVFADLGLPDADEHLLKADVVSAIASHMDDRRLPDWFVLGRVGLTADELSRVLRGHFQDRSLEELQGMLEALRGG